MTNFDVAFNILKQYEFNSPLNVLHINEGERGLTFFGIYEAFYPRWEGWRIIFDVITNEYGDLAKISYLLYNNKKLMQMVKDFYKKEFWDYLQCNKIDLLNAVELFELSVNLGRKQGAKIFQKALNLLNKEEIKVDGIIGEKTLSLYKKTDTMKLYKTLNGLQFCYYKDLVDKNPKRFKRFFKGWLRRIDF